MRLTFHRPEEPVDKGAIMAKRFGATGLKAGIAATALATFAQSVPAYAQTQTFSFDIPAQDLGTALRAFAKASRQQVTFSSSTVRGKRSPALRGSFTARAALEELLSGSGLKVDSGRSGILIIREVGAASTVSSSEDEGQGTASEIVVTAQKRLERQIDVPVPVSVVSASVLTSSNQVRIEDYYTRIPGINVNPTGFGGPQIVLRGISTGGYANPTVGVVIDDVPFGSSTNLGGLGSIIPDMDPSSLASVEVLRGPQGTLYGASAMGGLLKFVTTDPSTRDVKGRIEGGISATSKGRDVGYGFRGSLNLPLNEQIAVAGSGFARFDPGFVDNVQTGQRDVNGMRVSGGRVAGLFKPSEALSIKLSALLQHQESHGADEVNPTFGRLSQSKLRDTGGINRDVQLYTGVINAELGSVKLTSVTGYGENEATFSSDYSPFYQFFTQPFGVTGAPLRQYNRTRKFSQELRFEGELGSRVDWLLGGFYVKERSRSKQSIFAVNSATGVDAAQIYEGNLLSQVREIAVFGDLTVHITDAFNIQVGGRKSFIRQTQAGDTSGVVAGGALSVQPLVVSKARPFTYLLTPQFKISPNLMVYARIASGFRVGGPNAIIQPGVPSSFQPDKTKNYEVGLKGYALDRKVTLDVSAYSIDWKNIQLFVILNGFAFYTNSPSARSQGVEASVEFRPGAGWTLSGWMSRGDAKLRSDLPPGAINTGLYGVEGDRLPQSARFAGSASIDKEFGLTDDVDAHVGISYSYQGNRPGNFASSAATARVFFPSYSRVDLRAGVVYANWSINLYANNLLDERTVLAQAIVPGNFHSLRPRTIGINIAKTF